MIVILEQKVIKSDVPQRWLLRVVFLDKKTGHSAVWKRDINTMFSEAGPEPISRLPCPSYAL